MHKINNSYIYRISIFNPVAMKLSLMILWLLLLCSSTLNAQTSAGIDSLKIALQKSRRDTGRVQTLRYLSIAYEYTYPDTSMMYAERALDLARELGFTLGESYALNDIASILTLTGNYPKALEMYFKSLAIREKIKDKQGIAVVLVNIGLLYLEIKEYKTAVSYFLKAMKIDNSLSQSGGLMIDYNNIGDAYERLTMYDSALYYQQLALEKSVRLNDLNYRGPILTSLGDVYRKMGNASDAQAYYRKGLSFAIAAKDLQNLSKTYLGLASVFRIKKSTDSSIYYAKKSIAVAHTNYPAGVLQASNLLADVYQSTGQNDSAIKYLRLAYLTNDTLFNQQKVRQIQSLAMNEQLRQQEIVTERIKFHNKIRTYFLIAALFVFGLIAFILYRNNRQKQKTNTLLKNTLTDLKATQAHLIQSEKMASLGTLTAGIAHEIQNPLNFVNNFSEINQEMIDEAAGEMGNGNYTEVVNLLNDIKDNSEKIIHHGKRADAIVKGMLQHSRTSSGKKEPIDINALCDEYLRLSYHGLRAKDKKFNADFKTNFDETLSKINVVPQEFGRVLLNLINNAFYAVNERKNTAGNEYLPTVTITTSAIKPPSGDLGVKISIKDNGNGIPDSIKDKIFQPFFTTKPTGSGTGLGLSLSYDIVKAHGGEIRAESKVGEGSEFVIQLPFV